VSASPPTIVGIYRRRNTQHVRRLLEPALEHEWRVGWWALDGVDPELDEITVGEGPGLKLPLLNETLGRLGPLSAWTLLSDDDLRFSEGDVVRFVELCMRGNLDLAQPARATGTQASHEITAAVRLSRARLTTFVESGPLVAVGPRCRDLVLPLPESRGMGWGVEIDWHDLGRDGCRLGIVDSTPIEHLGEWAGDYDLTEMRRELLLELAQHGHPMWHGMRETLAVWRPWRRRPNWSKR
jgi:hypothetical protein